MMRTAERALAQKYLETVRAYSEKRKTLRHVYRNMRKVDLFLRAYANLYANEGATTQGIDPNDTVDGMSLKRIHKIIERLEQGRYVWKPVRRTYIEKDYSDKLRPLGIPCWNDKLVQEVMRMILQAYYEPQFSNLSHGFRPGRGCHTALKEIYSRWAGVKWFIEGDIKGCFDNISHRKLLEVIGKSIEDKRFLNMSDGDREQSEQGEEAIDKHEKWHEKCRRVCLYLSNLTLNIAVYGM